MRSARGTRTGALVAVVALCIPVAIYVVARVDFGRADTRPADPTNPATPATVSADPLPTTQVDGVVWSQAVVGNRVFAGGSFANARPAGAAVGVGNVPRPNLLAYDITTGDLDTSFAPTLNAQARVVAASPDGSRVYVGGDFTTVNGLARNRIAAFDTASGALVASFAPNIGYHVYAIAVTPSVVYVGGNFQGVGAVTRRYLAAFRVSDGALLDWAPSAGDGMVTALAVSPDGSKVAVGGRFTSLNGSANPGYGLGFVDAITGASLPMAANSTVRNGGAKAGITSLHSDGTWLYGTGYTFGVGGVLEGTFKAAWADGTIDWVEDCHGDTYSSFVQADAVYVVGHPHYCGNVGGFQQANPWFFRRALAFSKARTGTITKEPFGYFNWEGTPAPSPLTWYPEIEAGTYTGQTQGPWHVTGNSQYVVLGGEFPKVNGMPQQGLVRFAVAQIAPNKQVPRLFLDGWPLKINTFVAGQVQLNWSGNWDRDNETLTYRLYREGTSGPIFETVASTKFWDLPTMSYTDTGVTPGSTYRYRVMAIDPFGNEAPSNWTSVTVATAGSAQYPLAVMQDGPADYWRLGETTGATGIDMIGTRPLAFSGMTLGSAGALAGDADKSATFAGTSSSSAGSSSSRPGPTTDVSVQTWFRTNTTRGGKIVGYGNSQTGSSNTNDRHIYMDNSGRLHFGVLFGSVRFVVSSTQSYNDNGWHQVTATLGAEGMTMYVDGAAVASRADVTRAREYPGFWRIGGDNLANWANRPTSDWFSGAIDDVAVFHRVLSAQTIARHYTIGSTGNVPNRPPTAAFSIAAVGLTASVNGTGSSDSDGTVVSYEWDFGDGSVANGATATRTYAVAGTYAVTLRITDDDGAVATTSRTVTVTAPPATTTTVTTTTVAPTTTTTVMPTTTTTVVPTTVAPPPGPAPVASDTFERTIAGGLGSADLGGPWTITAAGSNYSVSGGSARISMPTAGSGSNTYLTGVSTSDAEVRVRLGFDKPASGNGTYVSVVGRRVGSAEYRAKIRLLANGTVQVILGNLDGAETAFGSIVLPGLTYTVGETLEARFQVSGTAPTTLRVKVWKTGQSEPTDWTLTANDAAPALQAAGHIGFALFLSGSATNAPAVVSLDNLWVGPVA